MNISKFIKTHPTLTACTLGFSIIGYLGYRAVKWITHKTCKTNKINSISSSTLSVSTPKKVKKPIKAKLLTLDGRESEARLLNKIYKAAASKKQPAPEIQTPYKNPAGFVNWVPGNFGLWMPGMAFLASHLLEKKDLEGLYVCDTLEAFASKIKKIAAQDQDERCAFIIPTCSSHPTSLPNFPQHKITVCVEKKAGQLTIAILDPEAKKEPIVSEHLSKDLWKGYKTRGEFNPQELALRAILKACRSVDGCNPRLLCSSVTREMRYGCSAFALQDAITYLQDPKFFKQISCSKQKITLTDGIKIKTIEELPPQYLIGVQSYSFFTKLKDKKGKSFFKQPLVGHKKNLQQHMDANFVKQGQGNPQNHYITKKLYRYLDLLIVGMKKLDSAEFNEAISKTLITEIDTDLFELDNDAKND